MCAEAGRRLGAEAPAYDARPVRARLEPLEEPLHRVAALLLVEVAMGETLSMCFFRAGRRAAREPLTRAALTSILVDEVRHMRLGWSALGHLWPLLSSGHRQTLQREATRSFAAFEQKTAAPALARLPCGESVDPAHAALGVIAPATRVEAFHLAVETLIVPRLTRLGLDGDSAWAERYRAV